jgi:hypothetical protein
MALGRGLAILGRGLYTGVRMATKLVGRTASSGLRLAARGGRALKQNIGRSVKKPRFKKPKSPRRPVRGRRGSRRPVRSKKDQLQIDQVIKFFKQHEDRVQAVKHRVLRKTAEHVRDDLLSRLPQEEKELRDSLQLGMLPGPNPLYVVRAVPKRKRVDRKEGETVLLYVQKTPAFLKPTPATVKVLIKYSPWTVDTLPFMPSKRDATIVKRRVDRKEVKKVRKMRARDKFKWKASLEQSGLRSQTKLKPSDIQALSDLGHQSVQMEFGLGTRSAPHWRPAVLWAFRGGTMGLLQAEEVRRALTDPRFDKWKGWKPVSRRVSRQDVQDLVAFQQKLGIGS